VLVGEHPSAQPRSPWVPLLATQGCCWCLRGDAEHPELWLGQRQDRQSFMLRALRMLPSAPALWGWSRGAAALPGLTIRCSA